MHRSGNDFSYVHNLKRGKHAFKFIVDDEWRFAPDQPTVADIEGRINNFIDVSDFAPYRKSSVKFIRYPINLIFKTWIKTDLYFSYTHNRCQSEMTAFS